MPLANTDGTKERDELRAYGTQHRLHCIHCGHIFFDLGGGRERFDITCPYCHVSHYEEFEAEDEDFQPRRRRPAQATKVRSKPARTGRGSRGSQGGLTAHELELIAQLIKPEARK